MIVLLMTVHICFMVLFLFFFGGGGTKRSVIVCGFNLFLILVAPLCCGIYTASSRKLVPETKMFQGVECGRYLRLTSSLSSVSQLPRQCRILNISQPSMPPRPVMGITSFLLFTVD
jgi:hypothetical protein